MAVKHTAEVTVYDVSDAYSVTLTNEAVTFKATSTSKLNVESSATTKPQAFLGSDAVACTVTVADCVCSDSTNCSVTVNSTGDNATWPLITILVGANATTNGTVTIPVVIGSGDNAVTIEKVFSYAIALQGTGGAAAYNYFLNASPTAIVRAEDGTLSATSVAWDSTRGTTGNPAAYSGFVWSHYTTDGSTWTQIAKASSAAGSGTVTIPSAQYAAVKAVRITLHTAAPTDANKVDSVTIPVIDSGATGPQGPQGIQGNAGTAGGRWYSGTGITGTSTTATAFSGSGVSSAVVGDMYLNTSTYNTYRCTVAGAASAAKWVYVNNVKGAKGDAGDNPYTLSITTSAGNVLRNNSGSTTLTCHIFKAGAELSSVPSGLAVKWYKNGTYMSGKDGLTLQVNASDVDSEDVFCAKLEG